MAFNVSLAILPDSSVLLPASDLCTCSGALQDSDWQALGCTVSCFAIASLPGPKLIAEHFTDTNH